MYINSEKKIISSISFNTDECRKISNFLNNIRNKNYLSLILLYIQKDNISFFEIPCDFKNIRNLSLYKNDISINKDIKDKLIFSLADNNFHKNFNYKKNQLVKLNLFYKQNSNSFFDKIDTQIIIENTSYNLTLDYKEYFLDKLENILLDININLFRIKLKNLIKISNTFKQYSDRINDNIITFCLDEKYIKCKILSNKINTIENKFEIICNEKNYSYIKDNNFNIFNFIFNYEDIKLITKNFNHIENKESYINVMAHKTNNKYIKFCFDHEDYSLTENLEIKKSYIENKFYNNNNDDNLFEINLKIKIEVIKEINELIKHFKSEGRCYLEFKKDKISLTSTYLDNYKNEPTFIEKVIDNPYEDDYININNIIKGYINFYDLNIDNYKNNKYLNLFLKLDKKNDIISYQFLIDELKLYKTIDFESETL